MVMISVRRTESLSMDPDQLTPEYQAMLDLHIQIGRTWRVSESGHNIYEIGSPRLVPNYDFLSIKEQIKTSIHVQ